MKVFKICGKIYDFSEPVGATVQTWRVNSIVPDTKKYYLDHDELKETHDGRVVTVCKAYSVAIKPEDIIGTAKLTVKDDGIYAEVFVNAAYAELYSEICEDEETRARLRFGFVVMYAHEKRKDPETDKTYVRKASITYIVIDRLPRIFLNTRLGGGIDSFGWEEFKPDAPACCVQRDSVILEEDLK